MRRRATIRPVSFEERIGTFRVVTDAKGMGAALLTHCEPSDPYFQKAAVACLALESGDTEPEQARADFLAALKAAGLFVRDP